MRRHACHLTSAHHIHDVRIFEKECKSLVAAGYRVSLVAPTEEQSTIDGVEIVGFTRRDGRFGRFVFGFRDILLKAFRQKADVYHFHDPDLIPLGMLLSLAGKRVIYDVHEDVPRDILVKQWIPKPLRYVLSAVMASLEFVATRFFFKGVVTVTPRITERFPATKTAMVCNFPKLEDMAVSYPAPFAERQKAVLYLVNITAIRAIHEVVDAMSELEDSAICLKLAGEFESEELRRETQSQAGWARVDFLGWLDRAEVSDVLGDVRAGLVLSYPTEAFKVSYAVKMFEYMYAGLPVIASNFDLWAEMLEGDGYCALLVNPLDPLEIAKAIDWLVSHPAEAEAMGQRGRELVLQKFNWNSEEQKLLALYQSVLQ